MESVSNLHAAESLTQNSLPSSPMAVVDHCVTIFFPSLAGDTFKLANNQDCCSLIERHGFALVLLACCLKLAIGKHGHLRIVACNMLTVSLLAECAEELGFTRDWEEITPAITRFSSFTNLESAMSVGNFVQSLQNRILYILSLLSVTAILSVSV